MSAVPSNSLSYVACLQIRADMCRAQGCSASQCGLVPTCSSTATLCAQEYMECSSSQVDRCSCTAPYVMCMADGGCIDTASGIERVRVHDMCLRDGCTRELCHLLSEELEPSVLPSSRARAVEDALKYNESCTMKCVREGGSSFAQCTDECRNGELSAGSKLCEETTLRCSREYADCATRTGNEYTWTAGLIRSGYVGFDLPYQIEDEGQTIVWPAMDGSAAARPRSPLPKGKVCSPIHTPHK